MLDHRGGAILLIGPSSPHQSRLQQLRPDGMRRGPLIYQGSDRRERLRSHEACKWCASTTINTNHQLGTNKYSTSTGQAFRAVRKQLDGVVQQQQQPLESESYPTLRDYSMAELEIYTKGPTPKDEHNNMGGDVRLLSSHPPVHCQRAIY